MATAYTSLLGLALPVTGELSGTWGSTVNTEITALLDSAIAGTTTLSTDADVTLTTTTGAANTSRQAILLCSGARTVLRTITAPAQSKIYTVINATTGGFSVKLVGAGPTTGVTIVAGESAVCAWNGSDFIKISNTAGVGTFTNLTVTGTLGVTGAGSIQGLTVGLGAGAVATNTAVGASALAANTTGNQNVAVGYQALTANTTDINNTAVGYRSLATNTIGGANSAFGSTALVSNTTGNYNIAVGGGALGSNTTASNNTAVGYQAGYSNTTASNNTAVGYQAAYSNSTATTLTAIGWKALYSSTAGINTAVGYVALFTNTTGTGNTAIGGGDATTYNGALGLNTTGSNNTAVGNGALQANTTASDNTVVGYQAGYSGTTTTDNVFIGYQAGYSATTGNGRGVFVGKKAGYGNTTGTDNVCIGYLAGYTNQTGIANVYIGGGYFGSENPAGYLATGSQNTFVGYSAGNTVTTGAKNTILGGYDGNQGGLDIRTASNYIVLSDGDGNPRQIIDSSGNLLVGTTSLTQAGSKLQVNGGVTGNQTFVFVNTQTSGDAYGIQTVLSYTPNDGTSRFMTCGDSTTDRIRLLSNGGIANYQANDGNLSDRREKTNFAPATSYLDKICAIPVQTFNYIDQNLEEDGGLTLGVVAQDVQAVAPELVMESNWGTKEEPKMRLSIYQTDLQYALMKCIQELKAEVDSLKSQLNGASA